MKLAPITTARFEARALGDKSAAVGERAQIVDVREIASGNVEPHRLGAGGEQERVVGVAAAVRELHLPARRVDRGDARAQAADRFRALCRIPPIGADSTRRTRLPAR